MVSVRLKTGGVESDSIYILNSNITVIQDNLSIFFKINGVTHQYLQWGFRYNNQMPSDPNNFGNGACTLVDNLLQIYGAKIVNGENGLFPFNLYIASPSKGNRSLIGPNASGEDDMHFTINTQTYYLSWRKRMMNAQ
ncbi:MAG: hypothetical protein ACK4GL_03010 [Flavobacteriales bacterium]